MHTRPFPENAPVPPLLDSADHLSVNLLIDHLERQPALDAHVSDLIAESVRRGQARDDHTLKLGDQALHEGTVNERIREQARQESARVWRIDGELDALCLTLGSSLVRQGLPGHDLRRDFAKALFERATERAKRAN